MHGRYLLPHEIESANGQIQAVSIGQGTVVEQLELSVPASMTLSQRRREISGIRDVHHHRAFVRRDTAANEDLPPALSDRDDMMGKPTGKPLLQSDQSYR